MDLRLAGRSALITGSTGGIGYAIAETLAREGVKVFVNGRTEARVLAAVESIRKAVPSSIVDGVAADVATEDGAETLHRRIAEVDILVNNFGTYERKFFFDIDDDAWRRTFELNVISGIRLCRLFAPAMRNKGWGRIIFISSESGLLIPVEMIHYGVSKTMQIAVARGLAKELAGTGVTVNSVLPGPTRSEGFSVQFAEESRRTGKSIQQLEEEVIAHGRPSSIVRRVLDSQEIANLVAYVASDLSSATTGASLRADGGIVTGL